MRATAPRHAAPSTSVRASARPARQLCTLSRAAARAHALAALRPAAPMCSSFLFRAPQRCNLNLAHPPHSSRLLTPSLPQRSFHSTPPPRFLDTMLGSFTNRVKTIWTGDGKAADAKPATIAQTTSGATTATDAASSGNLDSLLSRTIPEKDRDEETIKDESELKSVEERIFQRGTMDLEDYRTQLTKSTKLAGKAKLLKYIPGTSQYTEALKGMEGEMENIKAEVAVLDAMTMEERKNPALLLQHGFKRKQRIATACNQTVADVNKSLERYEFMREILSMAQFKKEGKSVPEDPKELNAWAKKHPEALKRLRKFAPSGSSAGAMGGLKTASHLLRQ